MICRALIASLALGLTTACGGSGTDSADSKATEGPSENVVQPAAQKANGVVNVYSGRHYDSDRIMYDTFEAETGIKVRLREASGSALLETMKVEGEASPADLVITSDAGALYRFQDAGLLQPLQSDALEAAIPANFREPEGHWFGFAKRARVIVYDPTRLSGEQVDEYIDLAAPELQGDICMRSSSNIYNLSLMADMIERLGADQAEATAKAIVNNFARAPKGGDTAQIQSVAAGECAAAFVNHYYWVRLTQSGSDKDRDVAAKTKLSFPEQDAGGTHVNVTGAGLAANAPNKDNAIKLLEWLATTEGQSMLVTETREFPMVEGAALPAGLEALPDFKQSQMPLSVFGERQAEAQMIYDRAGWN